MHIDLFLNFVFGIGTYHNRLIHHCFGSRTRYGHFQLNFRQLNGIFKRVEIREHFLFVFYNIHHTSETGIYFVFEQHLTSSSLIEFHVEETVTWRKGKTVFIVHIKIIFHFDGNGILSHLKTGGKDIKIFVQLNTSTFRVIAFDDTRENEEETNKYSGESG